LSHTVLVCDDAIFMRTMVGDILTQAGFEIVGRRRRLGKLNGVWRDVLLLERRSSVVD